MACEERISTIERNDESKLKQKFPAPASRDDIKTDEMYEDVWKCIKGLTNLFSGANFSTSKKRLRKVDVSLNWSQAVTGFQTVFDQLSTLPPFYEFKTLARRIMYW